MKRAPALSIAARRCLATLFDAEFNGKPIEFHTWRAANARKIPLLQALERDGAIEGDTYCAVTFWGLMNVTGEHAKLVMAQCERNFKALRRHYAKRPKEPMLLDDLSKQTRLAPADALRAARFLSRSPLHLSIHTSDQTTRISPNENYVTAKNLGEIVERARENATRRRTATLESVLPIASLDLTFVAQLATSECDGVRENWGKAIDRLRSDASAAITSARSLVEAGCRYVLEEYGETDNAPLELPRLYRRAAQLLQLDPTPDVVEPLRRALQSCATLVDSLAELRNKLGDAHGKGRNSVKPSRRHAELVVMIAGAITGFLMATLDARRKP